LFVMVGEPKKLNSEVSKRRPMNRTGNVTVNGLNLQVTVPFGGYKQSGIGRVGGPEGLEGYQEIKTVICPAKLAANGQRLGNTSLRVFEFEAQHSSFASVAEAPPASQRHFPMVGLHDSRAAWRPFLANDQRADGRARLRSDLLSGNGIALSGLPISPWTWRHETPGLSYILPRSPSGWQ
jgi:hypothetical protein